MQMNKNFQSYPFNFQCSTGVWALGFTLSKLVKNVCVTINGLSTVDRKRNCLNRLQQVFDTDKPFVRNITVNLNEKVNIRMSNQMNATFEEDRLQFDKSLQLTTIHYTISKLNNSQLVKIAYFTECCGMRTLHTGNLDANFDLLNPSMQPMLLNNAYSILSSSNHYQINRPTQSTPSFGTRLSTRKTTTIFINPTKQTSTTVTIENTANSTEGMYTDQHQTEQSMSPETTTDITRLQSDFTTSSDSDGSRTTNSFSDSRSTTGSNESTESSDATEESDSPTTNNRNRFETSTPLPSTMGTTLRSIEVVRITAEPESNDVFLDKLERQNYTKVTAESLDKRNNFQSQFSPSNQTRYVRKPLKENTTQKSVTGNLAFTQVTSRRKATTTTRPYIKEQVLIKNGKIVLGNNTANNLSNARASIASVISDRHSLNQFRRDNEAEIERRFSIVILFLSIGE